jgi:hypothetical protein
VGAVDDGDAPFGHPLGELTTSNASADVNLVISIAEEL